MSKYKYFSATVVIFGILLSLNLNLQTYIFDDAYIHIRIASHLAQYGQPYYNFGEAVNASSSAIWILILALIFKLLGQQIWIISVLNAGLTAAGTIIFFKLISKLLPDMHSIFHWLGAGLYLSIVMVANIGGMEIPLSFLLFGIALHLLFDKKESAFAILGLLIFVRLEFAALLVIVFIITQLNKTSSAHRAALYSLSGMFIPIIYQLNFFNSLIPNTIIAKPLVFPFKPGQTINTVISTLIPQTWIMDLGARPISIEWMRLYIVFILMLWLVTILLHFKKLSTGQVFSIILMGFGLAVAGVYSARAVLIFPWYVAIYALPITIALFTGLALDIAPDRRIVNLFFFSPLVFYQIGALVLTLASGFHPAWYPTMKENARVEKFKEIGAQLYAHYPGAHLMVSDIGGLGYSFPGYIIDVYGLVTPEILPYYRKQRGVLPLEYIAKKNPELIVCLNTVVKDFADSPLSNNYIKLNEPIYTDRDLAILGSQPLWDNTRTEIYIRRDLVDKFGLPTFK